MNSGASLQRKSFSDTQPFCWIMSGAHSLFHTRTALSLSDGSILMWMRRMTDMGVLLAGMARGNRITRDACFGFGWSDLQHVGRIERSEVRKHRAGKRVARFELLTMPA